MFIPNISDDVLNDPDGFAALVQSLCFKVLRDELLADDAELER